MQRFRLRFLLQELDISGPEVVLGRSPECHVSIDDPLISRQHARIAIRGDRAFVTDLGSRNGVRVNGRLIDREHELMDGDRLRLGTQDLVFSALRRGAYPPRPTGSIQVCAACSTPYPEESAACPHCGASSQLEEDTVTSVAPEPGWAWSFQLLGEVIERALSAGRHEEAARLMRRATREVDERLARGERVETTHVLMVSDGALRLAGLSSESEWVAWTLDLHRGQERLLTEALVGRMEALTARKLPNFDALVREYVAWARARAWPEQGTELARLERLERAIFEA
jgi:hypothetical protein